MEIIQHKETENGTLNNESWIQFTQGEIETVMRIFHVKTGERETQTHPSFPWGVPIF